jgi:hypothetical protein
MRMEKQSGNENGTQRTLKTTRGPKQRPKDLKERRNSVTNAFFVSNSKKSPVMRQYSRLVSTRFPLSLQPQLQK